jgi:hypothetical protein
MGDASYSTTWAPMFWALVELGGNHGEVLSGPFRLGLPRASANNVFPRLN